MLLYRPILDPLKQPHYPLCYIASETSTQHWLIHLNLTWTVISYEYSRTMSPTPHVMLLSLPVVFGVH